MKKYQVTSKAGSYNFDSIIQCDYFSYGDSGAYYFHNSQTGEEWWYPVMHTIVKKLINK